MRVLRRLTGVLLWLLLVPAALLTLVRLVDSDAGTAVRVEAFTPLAIPAYGVALVLLALRALLPGSRRRTAVVAVPVVAALALHAWWYAPLVSGEVPAADPAAEPLVVMTANVLAGEADAAQVVAAARGDGVEVLVVEEITSSFVARLDEAGVADLLPHRAGQAAPGTDTGGTMVFSTLPLDDARQVDTLHGSWVVTVGGDLTLMAVHPAAPTTVARWRSDHALLLETARATDADLVVGDFNATDDHEPMRTLEAAGWRDVVEVTNAGWQPTWPSNGLSSFLPVPVPLTRIDHVLVGERLTATSVGTLDIEGTDHRAVVAEVVVRADRG